MSIQLRENPEADLHEAALMVRQEIEGIPGAILVPAAEGNEAFATLPTPLYMVNANVAKYVGLDEDDRVREWDGQPIVYALFPIIAETQVRIMALPVTHFPAHDDYNRSLDNEMREQGLDPAQLDQSLAYDNGLNAWGSVMIKDLPRFRRVSSGSDLITTTRVQEFTFTSGLSPSGAVGVIDKQRGYYNRGPEWNAAVKRSPVSDRLDINDPRVQQILKDMMRVNAPPEADSIVEVE